MSNERVKQYRLRQKALGRVLRHYYLADSEHLALKNKLKKLRGNEK